MEVEEEFSFVGDENRGICSCSVCSHVKNMYVAYVWRRTKQSLQQSHCNASRQNKTYPLLCPMDWIKDKKEVLAELPFIILIKNF